MATQLYDDFRHNMGELMRRRGLTQVQMAEELGVTQSYVSQMLSGRSAEKRGVGLDTVERIAHILGVSPATLLKQNRTVESA